MSTLMALGKAAFSSDSKGIGGFTGTLREMWYNPDENLRTAYRSNIKHILFDLFFMLGVGNLVAMLLLPEDDELKKEHFADRGDLDKAVTYASYNFFYKSFRNSFMDFNFIDSIFSPVVDWQPMSLSCIT